jgi:hypothetical protein
MSRKYQDLDLGREKRREERKRRRAWQGERREPPSPSLAAPHLPPTFFLFVIVLVFSRC